MVKGFAIAGRAIGPGAPCFIIAEAGVNHDGELDKAIALIDAAAQAGADAVKFQTFSAERLVAATAPKAAYQESEVQESQLAMLQRLELSDADHHALVARCTEKGILFLSSPFDQISADFLADELKVPAFKVPSGELTNHAYLRHLAAKSLPMIVSTGMATPEDVAAAVSQFYTVPYALLHCVSAYPADPADCNLRAIATLSEDFNCPAGWSDHTTGIEVAIAAAALGAAVIEKHFTLDKNAPGPDHKASMEPDELAALVVGVRKVEAALGDGTKAPTAAEAEIASVARKSLVAATDLKQGEKLEMGMVAAKRPGTGLSPTRLGELLGKRLDRDVLEGEQLSLDMFGA